MKKLLLATALALAPVSLFAQAAPEPAAPAADPTTAADADPALWVVRDEDTTVYLFGTFHLLDGRTWFDDEVRSAFDASDELVLEAIVPDNPAELQPIVLRYAVDPQGRRLSERLTAEQNEALAQALNAAGVPTGTFDTFEPWFVSMTLASLVSQRLGISAANGPEQVLTRAARERNVTIGELEGIEWQIRLFDDMPEEQQLAQLRQTLDSLDSADEVLGPMLAAWSEGDVEALRRIIDSQTAQDPALHRLIFTDRNRAWAGWIRERMARPGTVFVAVGAGHLAGDDSVQAVLEESGLSAERVAREEEPAAGS
ncbi:TraB/GumN family protein [Sphingosinicella terrae]|uniref:TraB/GumN family protein n=1 Tax=Sphingosinicella terrae TaxID=2172047 RepID=UPI000E0D9CB8|nr:TraB/GumN family protein [Sphingosinicella terrae]